MVTKRYITIFIAVFVTVGVLFPGCAAQSKDPKTDMMKTEEQTTAVKPSTEKDKNEAPKQAVIESKYDILKDRVICIDPGHQAKVNNSPERIAPSTESTKEKMSWGTAGVSTGVPEYKLNLSVSLKLKNVLQNYGAKVIMTRETDEVDIGNIERAEIANSSNSEIFVRIHADGSENASIKGISVLYPGNRYIKNGNLISDSKKAASYVLNNVVASTGAISRGLSERDDMTGFNWCKVPVFLIEMGFMSNSQEDRLLNTAAYQDKMVQGMVDGLAQYFQFKSNK